MFPALGDQPAQNVIRANNPDVRHCGLLKNNPEACLECPLPENPYPGWKAKAAQAAILNQESVAAAHELYSAFELGILTHQDILMLAPEDVRSIRIMQEQSELHRSKTNGDIIAGKIAEIIVKVYGVQ